MAPCRSTDCSPSRLITTPDWLSALFVQVSWTDVVPTAWAVRFDGAAGTGVLLPIAALAPVRVDEKVIAAASMTAECRLIDPPTVPARSQVAGPPKCQHDSHHLVGKSSLPRTAVPAVTSTRIRDGVHQVRTERPLAGRPRLPGRSTASWSRFTLRAPFPACISFALGQVPDSGGTPAAGWRPLRSGTRPALRASRTAASPCPVCARDDAEAGSAQIATFGAVNAEQRTTKHAAQIRLIYARL